MSFDAVVFGGGGSRCFWQLGFWSVAAPALELRPRVVTAVSAGAAIACAALLDRCEQTLRQFKAVTTLNAKNVYPANLLRGEQIFPHHTMYRNAMLQAVDRDALERLHAGPDLRFMLARPPRWLGSHLSLLVGLSCYVVEKRLGDPVHSELAHRVGFTEEMVSVRRCRTPEELADVVLASSCTPPFTPALRWEGRPVLDGSLVDGAPLSGTEGCERTLVLLTRSYGSPPKPTPHRLYVGPSSPVPITKWDYASPDGLQQAYDLGRFDAETFLGQV